MSSDDRFRFLVLAIVGALICYLGHLARAHADDTDYPPTTVADATSAITSLLERPSPLLTNRASEVAEIATACVDVEQRWGVPCLLLVSMMHHESRFDSRAIGAVGERGLLQIHGVAAHGCDLESIRGQIECGATWLLNGYGACHDKDWFGALTWYASSRCKSDNNGKLFRKIYLREALWRKLQKRQAGE